MISLLENKMKQVLIFVVFFSCLLILCFSLYNKKYPSSCTIDNTVFNMLSYLEFEKCEIEKLGCYESIMEDACQISTEEIVEYIEEDLIAHTYKNIIKDRAFVKDGDYVLASYDISYNDQVLASKENEIIHVGSGEYDIDFENQLRGSALQEFTEFVWILPDNEYVYGEYNELVGEELSVSIYIDEIYEIIIPELTDEFVEESYDISSINDYKEYVYNLLLEEKKEEEWYKRKNSEINQIMVSSEFNMDQETVIQNAADIYMEYEEYAYYYNISLEEYAEIYLGVDIEQIYDKAYEASMNEIKRYLIIGAIAVEEGISVTDSEVEAFISENEEDIESISEENKCYIYYILLEQEVLLQL